MGYYHIENEKDVAACEERYLTSYSEHTNVHEKSISFLLYGSIIFLLIASYLLGIEDGFFALGMASFGYIVGGIQIDNLKEREKERGDYLSALLKFRESQMQALCHMPKT